MTSVLESVDVNASHSYAPADGKSVSVPRQQEEREIASVRCGRSVSTFSHATGLVKDGSAMMRRAEKERVSPSQDQTSKGGKMRPTVERACWDTRVLRPQKAPTSRREVRAAQMQVADRGNAEDRGLERERAERGRRDDGKTERSKEKQRWIYT